MGTGRAGKLSSRFAATVTKKGRHGDGNGLYLVVKDSGAKSWVLRTVVRGRRCDIGLGGYPLVSLAEARAAALEGRKLARAGGKSAGQWEASLRQHAFPRLGSKRVDTITTADVMSVLLPIWIAKSETARRVRRRIGTIMKWAIAQGFRDDTPLVMP